MKVLLVRLSSMGDLIHTLPAIDDLSKNHPHIELHWLSEASFADIACLHPFVKKVHTLKWRYWRKNLFKKDTRQAMSELKKTLINEQFDLVIDSQGLMKSAWFARYPQAPIAGFNSKSVREPIASIFYQQKYAVKRKDDAVRRARDLLSQVFKYTYSKENIHFGAKVPKFVDTLELPKHYHVALHATSKDEKLWPEEKWHELFELIHKQTKLPIYLPWGSEKEHDRAIRLCKSYDYVHVCPKLSLLQAALLLENAQSVVGVDTGLLHLANAFDIPIVGIYLDSNPAYTGVQPSLWAKNIGNKNENPSVNDVFELWQNIFAAKQQK